MKLIWRGWGLLAVVALFPLLASCAGLITVEPFWIFMLAAALSLLVAGVVCVHFGRRWNQHAVEHSFYFVPLQVWGWVYLTLVTLLPLGAIAGALKRGLDEPGRLNQMIAGEVGLVVVAGVWFLLIRSGRSKARATDVDSEDNTDRDSDLRAPSDQYDV